ncbi:EsaB/YukD family protein [Candidatus Laterigemmans baculatus]|uniref:EsaB/YukD family protein n=1 Tax=Candidatus Laterigemmans baculatus TaxID=2770505 RepID=UPI0013DBBF9D|nr:EsaB/YukD family protein [Candidatus Laterigemmans baculatus]
MVSSDPPRDAPPGVRVTFLDQTGAKSVEAMIAPSVTVARIVPNLITKLNLPVTGPDGQPMTYSLDHKEGGRRLREDESLVEAGVATGDHLIIYPEIVAGAGPALPTLRIPWSPR